MENYRYLLEDEILRVTAKLRAQGRDKLAQLFANCYANTFETTTRRMDDGTLFLVTGDIHAMWLRDSAAQVHQYLPLCAKNSAVADMVEGLIRRQVMYYRIDAFANGFNEEPNGAGHTDDRPRQNLWVFERKYEIDSPCYMIQLAYLFWKATGRTSYLNEFFFSAGSRMVEIFKREQNHNAENSYYRFFRDNCPESDTLTNNGLGAPVAYTGMTWSGFRPSDDACKYGYLIPANLFAVVALRQLAELCDVMNVYQEKIKAPALKLADEIEAGVKKYGIVDHPEFGRIYAYETDGMGNYVFMDDANVPSLLALPYMGCCAADDEVYLNTRRFVLSKANPYYWEGTAIRGLGSPHTPDGYVWHIGLALQGLTATDPAERKAILNMMADSDGGTGYMHEGVCADDPTVYTRPWFAWANSIFSELVLKDLEEDEKAEAAKGNQKLPGCGFHHLALRASDFDRSYRFYTEVLGFRRRTGWGEGEKRVALLNFGDGGLLELFGAGVKDAPQGCYWHAALKVDDVDAAFETAVAAGAGVHQPPKDALLGNPGEEQIPVRLAFIKGFDGELLEFFHEK